VVDASVAAKWVAAEEFSDQAATLLGWDTLYAPTHWMAEAVNALWGKVYRSELRARDAAERAAALADAPVVGVPLAGLMQGSFTLSIAFGITIYDSLYVALAELRRLPLVTADRRLVRRIGPGGLKSGSILWVGDLR